MISIWLGRDSKTLLPGYECYPHRYEASDVVCHETFPNGSSHYFTLYNSGCHLTLFNGGCRATLLNGNCRTTLFFGGCFVTLFFGGCHVSSINSSCTSYCFVQWSLPSLVINGGCYITLFNFSYHFI